MKIGFILIVLIVLFLEGYTNLILLKNSENKSIKKERNLKGIKVEELSKSSAKIVSKKKKNEKKPKKESKNILIKKGYLKI